MSSAIDWRALPFFRSGCSH